MTNHKQRDNDLQKGAVEDLVPGNGTNTSLHGQLGHRDQDPLLKAYDTDFPEPGENPEHSGERQSPETLPTPPTASQSR